MTRGGQANGRGVAGTGKTLTVSVKCRPGNPTTKARNIGIGTTPVANGDLSQKTTVEVKGEILALKDTMNTMVDQLNGFAGEVSRVAREVGTEGKLGGQAKVPGVAGRWNCRTGNVTVMPADPNDQVGNHAARPTALAKRAPP